MTILIHNGSVLTMNQESVVHTPGWLWVVDDRIADVGAGPPPEQLFTQADRDHRCNLYGRAARSGQCTYPFVANFHAWAW